MKQLTSQEELTQFLDSHGTDKVFVLKHSTRCPISSHAMQEFQAFAEANEQVPCAWINVIEHREVSNHLAQTTSVQHESPQVFVLSDSQVLFHTSHHDISQEKLEEQL